jgi:hypothetical protein
VKIYTVNESGEGPTVHTPSTREIQHEQERVLAEAAEREAARGFDFNADGGGYGEHFST